MKKNFIRDIGTITAKSRLPIVKWQSDHAHSETDWEEYGKIVKALIRAMTPEGCLWIDDEKEL